MSTLSSSGADPSQAQFRTIQIHSIHSNSNTKDIGLELTLLYSLLVCICLLSALLETKRIGWEKKISEIHKIVKALKPMGKIFDFSNASLVLNSPKVSFNSNHASRFFQNFYGIKQVYR